MTKVYIVRGMGSDDWSDCSMTLEWSALVVKNETRAQKIVDKLSVVVEIARHAKRNWPLPILDEAIISELIKYDSSIVKIVEKYQINLLDITYSYEECEMR